MPKLSIIVPCYFNEENLPVTFRELLANEGSFPKGIEFEYVFIDDGSKDKTFEVLLGLYNQFPEKIKVVKLAGNVGSYNAILAGMNYASGDCNVILTADLQDPPELIPKMFDYWTKGVKFVIANRKDREEPFFQRLFSNSYHYMIKKFALRNVPTGGFDLVLFDKELREEVVRINEKNTNTIYLLAWLDYDYVSVSYVRRKREIGRSRWTLRKKIKLFIDSFVSFSFMPIRAITLIGFILGFVAFLYGVFIIIAKFTNLVPVEGWSSMMVVLLFVSSFQMIAMGVLGEYIWRTLDATRNRPNFIVDKLYGLDKK